MNLANLQIEFLREPTLATASTYFNRAMDLWLADEIGDEAALTVNREVVAWCRRAGHSLDALGIIDRDAPPAAIRQGVRMNADIPTIVSAIANIEAQYEQLEENAENLVQQLRTMLIGMRYKCIAGPSRPRGEPAEFQITRVDVVLFELRVHGRKVLSNGKIGSQDWDLGRFIHRWLAP